MSEGEVKFHGCVRQGQPLEEYAIYECKYSKQKRKLKKEEKKDAKPKTETAEVLTNLKGKVIAWIGPDEKMHCGIRTQHDNYMDVAPACRNPKIPLEPNKLSQKEIDMGAKRQNDATQFTIDTLNDVFKNPDKYIYKFFVDGQRKVYKKPPKKGEKPELLLRIQYLRRSHGETTARMRLMEITTSSGIFFPTWKGAKEITEIFVKLALRNLENRFSSK